MKIQNKVGGLSLSLTVVIMYYGITRIVPLINGLEPLKFVGSIAAALGIYKLIGTSAYYFLNKSLWLRKKILGEFFLEGTWVGEIRRSPVEYTIEHFRYRDGELEIEGCSYLDGKKKKSYWKSTAVGLDVKNMKIVYAYECRTEGKEKPPEGIASFGLQWSDGRLNACNILEGFAADLVDGNKDSNTMHKVSDECIGFDKAFDKAIEIFASSRT